MSEGTNFWPLKKGIPTDEELVHLADDIQQDWKRLGAALGLKEKQLNSIEANNPHDIYERALAVLQKWKKKMGRKATYHKLAVALNDQLVQRYGLVKKLSSDNSVISIEENNVWLMKNGIPTDQELLRLAGEIPDDWKRIGRAVGLKEKHLQTIEINIPDDVCERAYVTLRKWKEKQGQEATYKKLARGLDDELVQRRDLVETFCCDVYPKSAVVSCRRYTMDQDEDGNRDIRRLTMLSTDSKEELNDTEPLVQENKESKLESFNKEAQPTEETKLKDEPSSPSSTEPQLPEEKDTSSFEETLQTWRRRESVRLIKEKTPSFRSRQPRRKSDIHPEDDRALEQIQQLRSTVEATNRLMQGMNEMLENGHESSKPVLEIPVTLTEEEEIVTAEDSDSQEETEAFYEAKNYLTVSQNEHMAQTKQEIKRHIEETAASGLIRWSSTSLAFTRKWWQKLFSNEMK